MDGCLRTTTEIGVPSAVTCLAVLPKANASDWAKYGDQGNRFKVWAKAMKCREPHVPWWISW